MSPTFPKNNIQIPIDGETATGKGTLGKNICLSLNGKDVKQLVTGEYFRGITAILADKMALDENTPIEKIQEEVRKINSITYELDEQIPFLLKFRFQKDVSKLLYLPVTANCTPFVAKAITDDTTGLYQEYRELVWEIANQYNIVVDGRGIGTTIFPEAILKIMLTASIEIQAERRAKQSGTDVRSIISSLQKRNKIDSDRKVSPNIAATDALIIDTTNKTEQQVTEIVLEELFRRKPDLRAI